mgnify:CR=1 FL=1
MRSDRAKLGLTQAPSRALLHACGVTRAQLGKPFIGIANAYYVGRMKNAPEGDEQRAWGDAIQVVRPVFAGAADGGTHVNISGAALARHAPNRDNAVKLLEYLVSDQAQSLYARANYEYPVKAGVELDPVVASFGPMKVDTLPLTRVAQFRKQASELVDRVGFDH